MTEAFDPRLTVLDRPPRWILRRRALKRFGMWHLASGVLPLYLVTEFPKSGGTWYSQMLSSYLGLPFARNNNPQEFTSSVLHGVHPYHPWLRNTSVVLRDGRDIMVSAYYHFLFDNEVNAAYAVQEKRAHLGFCDYDDVRANLPRWIEYMFTSYVSRRRMSLSQFLDSWLGQDVVFVRYEDLVGEPLPTMAAAIRKLTERDVDEARLADVIDRFSFATLSGRAPGEERAGSFMRKGIAGDWRNHFTVEAAEVFNHYAGEHLLRCGYESSLAWARADFSSVDD